MTTIPLLRDKRIVLGVCGSIAAYKAADLVSKLTQAGALVDVIMTAAAQRFVSPLTFQALSGRPVHSELWAASPGAAGSHIAHIALAEGADLLLIAPITAHTLAKLAQGFADDLLAITALAAACPLLIAPAMDGGMYQNPAVKANLNLVQRRGVQLIKPEIGRFASGLTGEGRLPETATLLGHIRRQLGKGGALAGRKLLITAGATRESLDPVRYLSNRSSGKQGYAIAQAALDAGADVLLLSTTNALPPPVGAQLLAVESAEAMRLAVLRHAAAVSAVVMAAAVADYRPRHIARQKIKKAAEQLTLPLERTADILLALQAQRAESGKPKVVVGFAAESEHLLENARGKLQRKGLDLLVANDITAADAGFAVDTNRVILLDKGGGSQHIALTSKAAVAAHIIERIARLLA